MSTDPATPSWWRDGRIDYPALVRLSDEEIDAALGSLSWTRDDNALSKQIQRSDFSGALAYVNEVGALAEELGHHPDIELRFDTVSLRLYTHVRGGVTAVDLELARRIDALG